MTATAEKIGTPSLDEQIAQLLKAPDGVPSVKFALTLFMIDSAITATEREAKAAQAAAFDPAILDPTAVGKVHDSEHRLKRLRASVEPLRNLEQQALKRERAAEWNATADDLELRVARIADEMIETYGKASAALRDLFLRIADVDAEVKRVNSAPGCQRTVRTTELVVRGIDGFWQGDLRVIEKCQLPLLGLGHGSAPMLWPLPVPNYTLQYAESVAAMIRGAPPPPTEAERAAEGARVIAHAEQMERGRIQNNEAAEMRARASEAEQRRLAAGGL